MTLLRKAERQKAKLRLGLSGPSGSGKTVSALLIAYGMTGDWNKIAVIDSENHSADLYANRLIEFNKKTISIGEFFVYPIDAPYEPEKYITALYDCQKAGIEVAIVDSITHEWSGKGGCLDIHESETRAMKVANSFTAWAKVTPRHQAFIDSILQSKMHIITTVRSKTEYVLTEKNGKQVPQKVGMATITRDGFEYELTASLDMDQEHKAFSSKDRTGLFTDKPSFIPTEETGKLIAKWCETGTAKPLDIETAIPEIPADFQTEDEKVQIAIGGLLDIEHTEPSILAYAKSQPEPIKKNQEFRLAVNKLIHEVKTPANV